MPDVVTLPDLEGLVSTFLQDDPTMAELIAGRCYTVVPEAKTFPLMRVTLIDDVKITQRPLWIVTGLLQLDSWGNTAWDATRTARTAQGVLAERLEGIHSRGIVNGVRFGGLRNVPDPDYTPAKHRRIFTAEVTAHPLR